MHQEPKAWIYCRIDAPEDVHGMLKVQRKQLMDYAEQMGFQVKGSSTDLAAGNSDILPGWEYWNNFKRWGLRFIPRWRGN